MRLSVVWATWIGITMTMVMAAGGPRAEAANARLREWLGESRLSQKAELKRALPAERGDGYVGSESCRACHGEEFGSWHRSYHRTMTQPASPAEVLGDFDGSEVAVDGLVYRVFREGDRFMAEMPDPDVMMYAVQGGRKVDFTKVPRVRLRVVMTTGSHHYQTYWVESPRYPGVMQTLPLVFLISERRWIPRDAAFMRGPGDSERLITQWNHHCIRCHSTGGNPGLDERTGMLKTEVGELGISCEACHGPAERHVTEQTAARTAGTTPGTGSGGAGAGRNDPKGTDIVQPERLGHEKSAQVCGQCHGVYVMRDEFAMEFARSGPLFAPGGDLFKTRYYPQHPRPGSPAEHWNDYRRNPGFFRELWWPDGIILAGGREYSGLLASPCHTRGTMSCLSCHSMHSSNPDDQLKPGGVGAAACTGCHSEEKYTTQITRHTRHAPGSTGSDCMNCHMPHTTYALFKAIRSHQITSPTVEGKPRGAAPNACSLCHLDKPLSWVRSELLRRVGATGAVAGSNGSAAAAGAAGKPRVEGVSGTGAVDPDEDVAALAVWLLRGDAAQRAVAAWHAGWAPAMAVSGAGWQARFLAELLEDPYPVVRKIAGDSLRRLPGYEAVAFDFLADASRRRAVREQVLRVVEQVGEGSGRGPRPDPATRLSPDRIQDLLRRRDQRSVTIKE